MRTTAATVAFLLLVLVCAPPARAGESVDLPLGPESVRAYLNRVPNGRGLPGIVLLHDAWGLNEQILGVADRLARLGYIVIAPDLYRGKLAADPGLAKELMRAVDDERAVNIVKVASDYLKRLDRNPARAVAVIGYGPGGRIAVLSAVHGADVRAIVDIYGAPVTDPQALAAIAVPVLGIFGMSDMRVPAKDAKLFETNLKAAGKDATIIQYRGVAHAFMDDSRADFDQEMALDGWNRMRDWLAVKLDHPGATAPAAPTPHPATP